MNCAKYKSWIEDAALDALEPRRDAELRAHLDACAACRAALEQERALTAAIDSTVMASVSGEPSPYFAARVRARIAEAPQRSGGFVTWLPLAAGAMAVIAVVGFWLWPRQPEQGLLVLYESPKVEAPAPAPAPVPGSVAAAPANATAGNTAKSQSKTSTLVRPPAGTVRVLIAPGEKAGFKTLYEFARAHRIDADALPNVAEMRKPLDTPELKIKPMEIAALGLLPRDEAAAPAPQRGQR